MHLFPKLVCRRRLPYIILIFKIGYMAVQTQTRVFIVRKRVNTLFEEKDEISTIALIDRIIVSITLT